VPELRELLAQALIGNGMNPWQDRVVETGAMTADLGLPPFGQLPFVVVRQITTIVDVETRIPTETFEVWVHAPAISFAALDVLERLAVGLIDGTTLTDPDSTPPRSFFLQYGGTLLGDQVIDIWDAYARGLRFTWTGGGINPGGPGSHDDPRAQWLRYLAGLQGGTGVPGNSGPLGTTGLFQCFGADWCIRTDPITQPPATDDCPLVWIRPLTGPQFVTDPQSNVWMTWYSERLAVHIVCPTQSVRDQWVDRIALALPRVLVGPEGDTWFLQLIATDYAANPEQVGQIIIELRFATLSCPWQETFPPFKEAVVALPENVAIITPPPSPLSPRPDPIMPRGGTTP
jgi:hypothetical protein